MSEEIPEINFYRKSYEIYSFTGEVVGSEKHLETKVTGSGGGGTVIGGYGGSSNVHISSKTVTHDQIFLKNEEEERSFQLTNINVSCREGHQLTVFWAVKKGKETGPYLGVVNHTTGEGFMDFQTAGKEFRLFTLEAYLITLIMGVYFYFTEIHGETFFFYTLVLGFIAFFVNKMSGFRSAKKFFLKCSDLFS